MCQDAWRRPFHDAPNETYKVLLVGEDNPQSADHQHALFPHPVNCAGERLCNKILQLPMHTYLALWRTNLCLSGTWNKREAEGRARRLLGGGTPWNIIVMMGAKVADAFAFEGEFYQLSVLDSGTTLLSLPHPSGRNRIWNSPGAAQNAREALQAIVPELWSAPTS